MPFNLLLAIIGGLILFLGSVSSLLKRKGLSDRLVALALGILLGPAMLNWIGPTTWPHYHDLIEQVARLTLGISLMSVALRLPRYYALQHWRSGGSLILRLCGNAPGRVSGGLAY